MLTAKPPHKEFLDNFQFNANYDIIENKNYIKILGITLRNDMNMSTQVGNLCANLSNRLLAP